MAFLLSLAVTAVALTATRLVRGIWQLTPVFGLLSGLGSELEASVLGPTVATRWLSKDRGLVTVLGAITTPASSSSPRCYRPLGPAQAAALLLQLPRAQPGPPPVRP